MKTYWKFALLFIFLLAFRTAFGLSAPFFSPDELQTYLIGLKCYTTGSWPFFGPDLIVTETGFQSQIPGALEGLLIGLPFHLLPIPEAPFLLVNLISLAGLGLLSFYTAKRLPEIPAWFIFTWLALLPWNLHESANTINPSYLLFGSCLFFVGFLEALPSLSLRWLPVSASFAFMGFGLFWDMQFHFSWILLPPFVLAAFVVRCWLNPKRPSSPNTVGKMLVGFFSGAALPLAFLVPTFLTYGLFAGASGMRLSVGFNSGNFLAFPSILARFFSLPSFELLRFIGLNTVERVQFLKNAWITIPGVFLIAVGFLQPLVLLVAGWFKDSRHPEALGLQRWTLAAFLTVWVSFWFTSKPPAAHIYYILLPLIALYSFYIGGRWAREPRWRILGVVCLAANLWFESGYMIQKLKSQSLYLNRPLVVKAIQEKDYRILAERRPGSLY